MRLNVNERYFLNSYFPFNCNIFGWSVHKWINFFIIELTNQQESQSENFTIGNDDIPGYQRKLNVNVDKEHTKYFLVLLL